MALNKKGLRLKIGIDLYSCRPKTETFNLNEKASVILCEVLNNLSTINQSNALGNVAVISRKK